jgi:predicted nucleic acid-binding protein
MLVVDSTVWIDYFNGRVTPQSDYLHNALASTSILVGDLILTEVLQGFRLEGDFEAARRALAKFTQADLVDTALAVQSARNYRLLRQSGFTVRNRNYYSATIDSIIAAYCIENAHDLLHSDADFDAYEKVLGLSVIHP